MADKLIDQRVDRDQFSFGTFDDDCDERCFWHKQTVLKRLEGIEFMRQVAYAYDPDTERLQSVFEIVECPWR